MHLRVDKLNGWLHDDGMSKPPDAIEDQLREAILTAGISRYQISQMTGVDEGMLSRFVHGHRTLTLRTASRVAAALGLCLTRSQKKGSNS